MNRRNLSVYLAAALLSGCSKPAVYDTLSQKPERQFSAAPPAVSAALASNLASNGFSIRSANDASVVARKFEPRLHGVFTPPPPDSSTEVQYTFTLSDNSGVTRVIADALIISIGGNGEEKSIPNVPNVIVEEMNALLSATNV